VFFSGEIFLLETYNYWIQMWNLVFSRKGFQIDMFRGLEQNLVTKLRDTFAYFICKFSFLSNIWFTKKIFRQKPRWFCIFQFRIALTLQKCTKCGNFFANCDLIFMQLKNLKIELNKKSAHHEQQSYIFTASYFRLIFRNYGVTFYPVSELCKKQPL
jgi:hypothetical protein